MEQADIRNKQEPNSQHDSANPPGTPQLLEKRSDNQKTSEDGENISKKKRCPKFKLWFKHNGVQSIIGILTFVTLIAYICVSQKQIHQTQKSIDLAESNSRIDLRAYIAIRGITFSLDEMKPLKWAINGTNTGKTPAYGLIGYGSQSVKVSDIAKFMADTVKNDVEVHPQLQSNGIDFEFVFGNDDTSLPKYVFAELAKKGITQYFFGYLQYRDVFGQTHRTRFCYATDTSLNVLVYKKYNDGD